MKQKNLKVFEAFAGIGAQRKALTNLQNSPGGGALKTNICYIGLAEWFVPAIVAYHAIHDKVQIINKVLQQDMQAYLESLPLSMNSKSLVKKGYWKKVKGKKLKTIYSYVKFSEKAGNIFDVHNLTEKGPKNIDLLTYSFPCQDLSIQGKGNGIKKGTRSGVLYEVERYIKSLKKSQLPKYLLLENVKALVNKRHKLDFDKWLNYLHSLGYKTDYKILNSQNFGSPQRRERVFALSTLGKKIKLPKSNNKKPKVIKDILNKRFDEKDHYKKLEKYKRSQFQINRGYKNIRRCKIEDWTTFSSETYVYDKNHIGPTLTASGANSRLKILEGKKIRMINPEESYRYMGFTTQDYKNVFNTKVLDSQKIIFTAGNSIPVQVMEEIFNVVI